MMRSVARVTFSGLFFNNAFISVFFGDMVDRFIFFLFLCLDLILCM